MKQAEVLDAITRERTRLAAAIDALGDGATTLPVTDEGWTAKDVLAHLIHWETQVAFGLGAQVGPPAYMMQERERRKREGLPDTMPTGDESNALAVAYYRDRPLPDVRATFDDLATKITDRIQLRSDAGMLKTDAVPWAPGRPLWQFIAGDTFEHWPIHAEAIERARLR